MPKYRFDQTPREGSLDDYSEQVELHRVDETKWDPFWDYLVQNYHYLGYDSMIGARIKYVVTLGKQVVGAISYCSAVYQLGLRDNYVGWDDDTRLSLLPHLVQNNRFLILPWIRIRNLASHVLAMSLRALRSDWMKQYGLVPYMAETFVDRENYLGTCYSASNWVFLGVTKGYGKQGNTFVYHGRKKDYYVYVMSRSFERRFKPDITRVIPEDTNYFASEDLRAVEYAEEFGKPPYDVIDELQDHLGAYYPYLGRKDQKPHMMAMARGLMSDLEYKSIEPIAKTFEGPGRVRGLTGFMSDSNWDFDGMMDEYRYELANILTGRSSQSMIIASESDFTKKGKNSIGVARQYSVTEGRKENCQAGLFVGYAGPFGYGLADFDLYIPECWFTPDYAVRLAKCKPPEQLTYRDKNEIMEEMLFRIVDSVKFNAKYVGLDAGFGSDPRFRDAVSERSLLYFAQVNSNQKIFLDSASGPVAAESIAEDEEIPWRPVVLGYSPEGPVAAQDKCVPVTESRGGKPFGNRQWLYIRRLDKDGKEPLAFFLCNAPEDAETDEIRKPAVLRWSIEQCFAECRQYLGMDHCEARSWNAWRRHILLTLITHLFVIKYRSELRSSEVDPDTSVRLENQNPDAVQQTLTIDKVLARINAAFYEVEKDVSDRADEENLEIYSELPETVESLSS